MTALLGKLRSKYIQEKISVKSGRKKNSLGKEGRGSHWSAVVLWIRFGTAQCELRCLGVNEVQMLLLPPKGLDSGILCVILALRTWERYQKRNPRSHLVNLLRFS